MMMMSSQEFLRILKKLFTSHIASSLLIQLGSIRGVYKGILIIYVF